MDWDYKMLQEDADIDSPSGEIARMYLRTHDKRGAKPNVSLWYDYCIVKGLHPFDADKPMPEEPVMFNVTLYRMHEESLRARRFYGKGGLADRSDPKRKFKVGERKNASLWNMEYHKRWQSLSTDEKELVKKIYEGRTDKNYTRDTSINPELISKEIRTFAVDISKVQKTLLASKDTFKEQASRTTLAKTEGKVIIKKGVGDRANGIRLNGHFLREMADERDRILGIASSGMTNLNNVAESILKRAEKRDLVFHPVPEPEPAVLHREDDIPKEIRKLLDLTPNIEKIGKSLDKKSVSTTHNGR